ncbi:MAG TPA: HEAT repeat domain-containing protein [Pyrinomonadaceae bacterium]
MRPQFVGAAVVLFFAISLTAQVPPDVTIERSVRVLRNVRRETPSEKEQKERSKQIDEAWKVLMAAGKPSIARLKEEIRKVDSGKENDDFFKLNASVVIWQIGKLDEAEAVAEIWNTTPVSEQYTYVLLTAMEAAQTHDAKALPMLKAVLRDDKGSMFVGMHAMNVAWPLSHEFVWGLFGPNGNPVLAEVLDKSSDPVELKSAMALLSRAQYLPALPRIRQLSGHANDEVRRQAVQSLGAFGHPNDYEKLIAGLSATDPKEIFSYAYALYEFEDERAVKHLIPLLAKNDDQVRLEVAVALLHLLTPESFAAVKAYVGKELNPKLKEFVTRSITQREDKLPKNFKLMSRARQATVLAKLRNAELTVEPGAKPLTNQRLLEALRIWREKGRIYDSGFDWVGESQVIAAAKPENLDLILSTKATFYRRLSDECLYEVRDLDRAVKYIGRSRYRLGLGVTEKAELK